MLNAAKNKCLESKSCHWEVAQLFYNVDATIAKSRSPVLMFVAHGTVGSTLPSGMFQNRMTGRFARMCQQWKFHEKSSVIHIASIYSEIIIIGLKHSDDYLSKKEFWSSACSIGCLWLVLFKAIICPFSAANSGLPRWISSVLNSWCFSSFFTNSSMSSLSLNSPYIHQKH